MIDCQREMKVTANAVYYGGFGFFATALKRVFWSISRRLKKFVALPAAAALSLFTSRVRQTCDCTTARDIWRWWTTWTSQHHECHLKSDLRQERNCDNFNWIISFIFFFLSLLSPFMFCALQRDVMNYPKYTLYFVLELFVVFLKVKSSSSSPYKRAKSKLFNFNTATESLVQHFFCGFDLNSPTELESDFFLFSSAQSTSISLSSAVVPLTYANG